MALALAWTWLVIAGCAAPPPGETAPRPPDDAATPSGSNRRIFPGCVGTEAARAHSGLVGQRVRITWAWERMGEASAALRVPATVLQIDPPDVVVRFDADIPNLELFTSVWLYSGHIRARPDGSFGVDPCSATLELAGE